MEYLAPGAYVEEVWSFPPSVTEVDTAIPAFIGYTQIAKKEEVGDLHLKPFLIKSLIEYRFYFGEADAEQNIELTIDINQAMSARVNNPSKFQLYYSLQLYFANGGGPCYIISVGDFNSSSIQLSDLEKGLEKSGSVDRVTLIVFPDALNLPDAGSYYHLQGKSIQNCAEVKDRMALMDVYRTKNDWKSDIQVFRQSMKPEIATRKFAAAYFPTLFASLDYQYKDQKTGMTNDSLVKLVSENVYRYGITLADLATKDQVLYQQAKQVINDHPMNLAVAPAIAGVYASVDRSRGVWKAPANININLVTNPTVLLTDKEQDVLNIDPDNGLSINAIRSFAGRGPAIIWGARTLAGNDNEWRYVNVRRYFNMVEESIRKSTEWAVFEPNTAATWVRVKGMIENYLTLQWRNGALSGSKPEQAYFVKVGLGETMTSQDILEGRMNVEIGMAAVKPAEFIVLRFSHKLLQE